ncbi:MAG: 23S rRNA (guanosine(2251)-2'-O)-methyltransferase RlmB [Actinomycetota bacterium]
MSGRKGSNRRRSGPGGQGGSGGSSGSGGRNTGGAGRGGGRRTDRGGGNSGEGGGRRRPPKRGLGGDKVEGRHAVRELLLAGTRRVREVLVADDLDTADIVDDIVDLAHELDVPVKAVNRKRLQSEAASSAPQGVIARAAPLPEHDIDDLMARPDAFLLVLDGVTDPGNLGTILRTAECTGVTGIVLPRHRSVHVSPTVTKAAAGAVEHLPMAVVGGIPTALTNLSKAGVHTVGLDAGGTESVFTAPGLDDGPVALVLGAEGRGLSRLVRQRVDTLVAIPLAGSLNSLNVSAATAVACFEVVRRRNVATDDQPMTDPMPSADGAPSD